MDDIFKSYPGVKMFFKVGGQYFADNDKSHAEQVSRQSGLKLEEVYNPAFAKDEKPENPKAGKKGKANEVIIDNEKTAEA